MMAGEIEYENFMYENGEALYSITGHLMILIFTVLVYTFSLCSSFWDNFKWNENAFLGFYYFDEPSSRFGCKRHSGIA